MGSRGRLYPKLPISPAWFTRVANTHDDFIKWEHFTRYGPFVREIHRSPVNSRHFDVFFDLRQNTWLSKQSRRRRFETPSHSFWRHRNVWYYLSRCMNLCCWGRYILGEICQFHGCWCPDSLRPLQWRHNGHDSVSNHQPYDCLLNRSFRRRSKKTPKLRVTGLCAVNSPGTGEFPAQMVNNAENDSIWWRHHASSHQPLYHWLCMMNGPLFYREEFMLHVRFYRCKMIGKAKTHLWFHKSILRSH